MKLLISVLLDLTGHVMPGEALVVPFLLAMALVAMIASGMAGRIALWCDAWLSRSSGITR